MPTTKEKGRNMSDRPISIFSHERQCFVMRDTRPPANAFEWRRYVVEEDIRRGLAVAADPKKRVRSRPTDASPITRTDDTRLDPKGFVVFNKVRKGEGK